MISRLSIERAAAVAATLFLSLVPLFAQYPGSKYYPLVEGSSVTFQLKADAASEVKVFGDFLPGVNEYGLGGSAAMTRSEDGMWTYTATGLAPEFYFYYFEVDGVRVLDPWNLKVACNYSEFYNTFLVEGAESAAYDYAREGKGSVETRWYDSPEYGGQRRLNVYLPAGYSCGRAYPVLYMLPGGGDDEDSAVHLGRRGYMDRYGATAPDHGPSHRFGRVRAYGGGDGELHAQPAGRPACDESRSRAQESFRDDGNAPGRLRG